MFREQEKLQLLKRFRQSVGPDVPWAGFYTIGEIGPVEEHNVRHLYTSVVLALVDDGRDHPSVTFDGGEAHLEQVGASLFPSSPYGSDLPVGK